MHPSQNPGLGGKESKGYSKAIINMQIYINYREMSIKMVSFKINQL